MDTVDIKVGSRCNNKCLFCIQDDKRNKYPDRVSKEILDFLEKGRNEGRKKVVFTGGEPTFRPKLLSEWVRRAKKIGYSIIQVQTNGRIFSYVDYCKEIISAGANEFGLALHGSSAAIHDRLTQVPGSFDQTTRGIKNLKSLNQRVLTNSVVNKINYKDLPSLAKLLVSFHVGQFQLAFMHINRTIADNEELVARVVPRISAAMPYIKKALDIGIRTGVNCMTEAIPYCCMTGYEGLIAEKIIPPAHVFDADIELEEYEKYRKNQGKIKGPKCDVCRYQKICEGPWREYPEIFGWKEFRPVRKEK